MDEALVAMIIEDTQPFSIVEDQGFRKFVKALNPNYNLPTRKVCMQKNSNSKTTLLIPQEAGLAAGLVWAWLLV